MNIFDEYEEPARALRVWKAYESELDKRGLESRGEEVAGFCRTADTLDVKLYLLCNGLSPFFDSDIKREKKRENKRGI